VKHCILLNPQARSGQALGNLEPLLDDLPDVEIRTTRGPGHARELAAEAAEEGFETVVAAGGDGTLNEVVDGLAGHFGEVRLGLLPLGTGNDFARTLGLPDQLEAAVSVLRRGKARRCDVVRFAGTEAERCFINLSAAGFSGEVDGALTPDVKRTWGPLAYMRAAVETLPELCAYTLELTFDGGETLEVEAFNLLVANGRYVAAGIPVAPEAEIDDGLLDVVVIRECPLTALAVVVARTLAGQHLADPVEEVIHRRTRKLGVRSRPPLPINVDGEPLGEQQEGRFELLPGALEVVAP